MLENAILKLASDYFASGDWPHFAESFADLYAHVRQNKQSSPEERQFCNRIIGPLAEFSKGDRTVESFREELAEAIRPFAQSLPEPIHKSGDY